MEEKETVEFKSSSAEPKVKMIGSSPLIVSLKSKIQQIAEVSSTVLIRGETGTGKDHVARILHELSDRYKEEFIAINCGCLSEQLFEAELFGYQKGAFTGAYENRPGIFEAVGKGTVFLDEIGEISPKLQISLLRVLENFEIKQLVLMELKKFIVA